MVDCGTKTYRVYSRTRGERGASLSMAILFIIVAATVGFIIVTAATVLSGRAAAGNDLTREQADQRQYILRSAARVIEDELLGEGGAYVCLQAETTASSSSYHVTSGILDAGDSASWTLTDSAQTPATVLEYLVWRATPGTTSSTIPSTNEWTEITSPSEGYGIDLLLPLSASGSAEAQEILANLKDSEGNVQILCRMIADEHLNITAEIGFYAPSNSPSMTASFGSREFSGETITLAIPATCTVYPEEQSTDPVTNIVTTTIRQMYVWSR